jgi:hypothetical protein
MASLSQDTTVQLKELLTAHLVSVEESVRG